MTAAYIDGVRANGAVPLWIATLCQSNGGEQGSTTDPGYDAFFNAAQSGNCCRRVYGSKANAEAETFSQTNWGNFAKVGNSLGFELGWRRAMGTGHALAKYVVGGSDLAWWLSDGRAEKAVAWLLARQAELVFPTYFAGLIMIQGESGPQSGWLATARTLVSTVRVGLRTRQLPLMVVQTPFAVQAVMDDQVTLAATDKWAWGCNTSGVASQNIVVATSDLPLNSSGTAGAPHFSDPEITIIGETRIAPTCQAIFAA